MFPVIKRKQQTNFVLSQNYIFCSCQVHISYLVVFGRKYCSIGSLDPLKVKGKIVYCTRNEDPDVEKSLVVAQAGGVGVILANQLIIRQIRPRAHFVPTSVVSADDGLSILTYVYSTK